MPAVSINIPAGAVGRVRDAWEATFTREQGETDTAFFQRIIREYVKKVVVKHEGRTAGASAQATAEATATTDIVIT